LLEQRYIHGRGPYRLCQDCHLSKRSLYYRLNDAVGALAQALWSVERIIGSLSPTVPTPGIPEDNRARHLPHPSYMRLFGVERVLTQLRKRLDDRTDHWLLCVDGLGGLGKTAVAREGARRRAAASPASPG